MESLYQEVNRKFFASGGNGPGTTVVGLEKTAEGKGAYQATFLILKPGKE